MNSPVSSTLHSGLETSQLHVSQYAVLGNPVEHSFSPRIQTLFAQATGQGATFKYGRIKSSLDGFRQCVTEFAASGAQGCNITLPFKFEVLSIATHATARAQLAGAGNILRFDITDPALAALESKGEVSSVMNHVWWADNTDGVGLVRDITNNAGISIEGRRVLLIGAGGACAGVLGQLIEARPESIMVANRTVHKAEELVQRHRKFAQQLNVHLQAADLQHCGRAYSIVINGTSASLAGGGVPVAAHVLAPGALALDMMYGQAAKPFLSWAKEHDAHGRDGLGMLVEQAAESFFFWRGVRPNGSQTLEQLRQELEEQEKMRGLLP